MTVDAHGRLFHLPYRDHEVHPEISIRCERHNTVLHRVYYYLLCLYTLLSRVLPDPSRPWFGCAMIFHCAPSFLQLAKDTLGDQYRKMPGWTFPSEREHTFELSLPPLPNY